MRSIPYRELIGKFLYLAVATRPDVTYAVGALCRFVENPGLDHWNAAKRVLWYLKGLLICRSSTRVRPLRTSSLPSPTPTWAVIPITAALRVALPFVWVGRAIQWGGRLHPHVSLSSTESEYTTVAKVGCGAMWMRFHLEEFGYDVWCPFPVLVDNQSVIQVTRDRSINRG